MSEVVIYHNQACSKSRNTLALIRNSGVEPKIINYLETPPSKEELKKLISDMGISVRDLIRTNEAPYKELGLKDKELSDDYLIEQMVAHPKLINRPIVVTSKGTRLCRPEELVLEILENPQQGEVKKEAGSCGCGSSCSVK